MRIYKGKRINVVLWRKYRINSSEDITKKLK